MTKKGFAALRGTGCGAGARAGGISAGTAEMLDGPERRLLRK
jgi:hypothetical protein